MKSQSLSLSTVVIGVILLLVLAVVAFIFFRGTNNFNQGVNFCEACVASADECGAGLYENKPIAIPTSCENENTPKEGKFCCRAAGG